MEQIYLKIISDIQCLVYVDSEFVKTVEKGVVSKIPLRRGEYFVQLVSPINNDVAIEQVISLEYDRVLKVDFEQYLEKHIELIRDQDVEFCVIRNSYYNLILGKEITDAVYDSGASFVDGLASVERTGRYGCIDKFGREIISCVYDDVFLRDKNIYARLNGLWGLYDSHGNEMKPCQYLDKNLQFKVLIPFLSETISSYTGRSVVIIKDGKYGIVDLNGASIVPCIYDNMIYSNYSNCIKIELDGRCGLIDQDGKMLIPCIYEDLVSFNSGWAAVQKDKLWGCIDYQGAEILPFEYGSIENGRIKDHFDRVDGFNKKWGIIGSNGKLIADCIYDYPAYEERYDKITEFPGCCFIDYYASHYGDWSRCDCEDHPDMFVEGMYPVARDGEYGFIDETGNEVIPCMYGAVFNFNNGLARVISDDKWLFIDKCANVILEHKCEYVSDFYEDLARIESGLWGYIDKTGTIVIPCKYDRCSVFNNGIAAVRTSYNCKVDDSGNELIEDKASNKKDIWSLSDSEQMEILDSILNIKYQKRYKWRFIDGKGNNVTQDIDIDYDSVTPLNNILWLVRCSRGNLGIVDSTWKEILPCVYDEIYSLQDGLVEVRLNDKYGLFDKCGSEVLPIIYDSVYRVQDGLIKVKLNEKYGLVDKCGNEVLPIIYDNVHRIQDGLIKVKLNEKYGLVNKCGNEVLPIVYNSILQYSNGLIVIDLGGGSAICKCQI